MGFYEYRAPLGGPSGHQSSAITMQVSIKILSLHKPMENVPPGYRNVHKHVLGHYIASLYCIPGVVSDVLICAYTRTPKFCFPVGLWVPLRLSSCLHFVATVTVLFNIALFYKFKMNCKMSNCVNLP